jgi:hypothetical protein
MKSAMKPPQNNGMADELAAIARLRQQPSWRATKVINGAPTKWLIWPASEHLSLWVAAGLIILLFLLGWLIGVR